MAVWLKFEGMQKDINQSVRAGQTLEKKQHRVDAATICKSKHEGGLGLISIFGQARALSGRFFTWLLQEDTSANPLRELL
jgi:hypothetical protein